MSLLRILWGAAEGPGVSVPVPVGGGSVRRGRSVAASGVVAGAIVSVVRGRFAPVSCDSRNLGPSRPETPGERGLPVGTGETRIQPSSRGAGEHPGPLLRAGPSEGSIVARRDHEPLIAATCLPAHRPATPSKDEGSPNPPPPSKTAPSSPAGVFRISRSSYLDPFGILVLGSSAQALGAEQELSMSAFLGLPVPSGTCAAIHRRSPASTSRMVTTCVSATTVRTFEGEISVPPPSRKRVPPRRCPSSNTGEGISRRRLVPIGPTKRFFVSFARPCRPSRADEGPPREGGLRVPPPEAPPSLPANSNAL